MVYLFLQVDMSHSDAHFDKVAETTQATENAEAVQSSDVETMDKLMTHRNEFIRKLRSSLKKTETIHVNKTSKASPNGKRALISERIYRKARGPMIREVDRSHKENERLAAELRRKKQESIRDKKEIAALKAELGNLKQGKYESNEKSMQQTEEGKSLPLVQVAAPMQTESGMTEITNSEIEQIPTPYVVSTKPSETIGDSLAQGSMSNSNDFNNTGNMSSSVTSTTTTLPAQTTLAQASPTLLDRINNMGNSTGNSVCNINSTASQPENSVHSTRNGNNPSDKNINCEEDETRHRPSSHMRDGKGKKHKLDCSHIPSSSTESARAVKNRTSPETHNFEVQSSKTVVKDIFGYTDNDRDDLNL